MTLRDQTNLSGKLAFVTGGASGIGLGIARAFCAAGMRVVIASRNPGRLREAMAHFPSGASVFPLELDVTDRGAVLRAAATTKTTFGDIHVLCNNAGVNVFGPLDEASFDDWDWVLDVNLNGVVNCLVAFIPHIKSHGKGGHIINVASMGAFIPSTQTGIYTASKFAIRGLSECLRLSLAPHNIGVSLLCPGLTNSNIWQASLGRPQQLASSGFSTTDERMAQLAAIHSVGMDPLEVGTKALRGMLRNDRYIFSHPEFKEELMQINDELMAAVPDEEVDPRRLAVEIVRRKTLADARSLSDSLGQAELARFVGD